MSDETVGYVRVIAADGTVETGVMAQGVVNVDPCPRCGAELAYVESDRHDDGSFTAGWACADCPPLVMPSPPGGVIIDVKRNDDGSFTVKQRPNG